MGQTYETVVRIVWFDGKLSSRLINRLIACPNIITPDTDFPIAVCPNIISCRDVFFGSCPIEITSPKCSLVLIAMRESKRKVSHGHRRNIQRKTLRKDHTQHIFGAIANELSQSRTKASNAKDTSPTEDSSRRVTKERHPTDSPSPLQGNFHNIFGEIEIINWSINNISG